MVMCDSEVEQGARTALDVHAALIKGLRRAINLEEKRAGRVGGANLGGLYVTLLELLCALFKALQRFELSRV